MEHQAYIWVLSFFFWCVIVIYEEHTQKKVLECPLKEGGDEHVHYTNVNAGMRLPTKKSNHATYEIPKKN